MTTPVAVLGKWRHPVPTVALFPQKTLPELRSVTQQTILRWHSVLKKVHWSGAPSRVGHTRSSSNLHPEAAHQVYTEINANDAAEGINL